MTRARRELVDLETTPYHHCICRCVRQAFLCGRDLFSGRNYERRRAWVLERLRELQAVYTVNICAFAVISKHNHLVVRLGLEAERFVAHVRRGGRDRHVDRIREAVRQLGRDFLKGLGQARCLYVARA